MAGIAEIIDARYGAGSVGPFGPVVVYNENIVLWELAEPQPTTSELYDWADANQELTIKPYKNRAIALVRAQAAEVEAGLPGSELLVGKPARARVLGDEIVEYIRRGRPQDPAENVFVVSNAIAIARGETLRDTLEKFFSKYRDIQMDVASILVELERLEAAIGAVVNSPTAEAEIEAIVAGATWPVV